MQFVAYVGHLDLPDDAAVVARSVVNVYHCKRIWASSAICALRPPRKPIFQEALEPQALGRDKKLDPP